MVMFKFGKKKAEGEACGCGKQTEPQEEQVTGKCNCGGKCGDGNNQHAKESQATGRFIVLGACCKKSTDTFNNTKQAIAELGFADEVLNVGDAMEIAKYGVMQTPALVIDSKVVSYGRLLKVEEVKKLVEKANS